MRARRFRTLSQLGFDRRPRRSSWDAPPNVEVKKARTTLEAARAAGKATQCPADFKAVEDMVTQAEGLCTNCKYEARRTCSPPPPSTRANALCPPPKPTPPPRRGPHGPGAAGRADRLDRGGAELDRIGRLREPDLGDGQRHRRDDR